MRLQFDYSLLQFGYTKQKPLFKKEERLIFYLHPIKTLAEKIPFSAFAE